LLGGAFQIEHWELVEMFTRWPNWETFVSRKQNLRPGSKNVFDPMQKHFLASVRLDLLLQHVSHAARLENIYVRNNVSLV